MAMARVVPMVGALSVLLVFWAHGAKSAASPEELRELRAKIERLQRDLAAAESSRSGAVDQLRESEKAVSEAHRALFVLAQERGVIEAELEAIAAREREARASVAGQQALAERLLRLQYQQGATDRLPLALPRRHAGEVARRIAYYGYIQRARAEVIGGLRNKAGRVEALELEARGRRDALAANHDSQEGEARVLERERAARAAVVQRLAGDVAKGHSQVGRLKRDETRPSRVVGENARGLAK